MKSNWFRKVLKEEIVEIDDTVPGVIEKLRSLNSFATERDSNNELFQFICNKKGVFSIAHCFDCDKHKCQSAHQWDREFYISGRVFSENGKTYIKYQHVNNKLIGLSVVLGIVYELLLVVFYIVLNEVFEIRDIRIWPLALLVIPLETATIVRIKNQREFKDVDLYKMENDMQRRINAVKRWND